MTLEEIKIAEIVRVTRKHKNYSWNDKDVIGRVESVNNDSIYLLHPNGVVQEHKCVEENEDYEKTDIAYASEYLFTEKMREEIADCTKKLDDQKKEMDRIMKFQHDFVNEMSLFARLKTMFNSQK